MDYWGMPHVRSHLLHLTFMVDMINCRATIPGNGDDIIAMTYTYDMAKFIVKLLETEDWPEFSVVVGDEITCNQLVAMGEEVRGMCIFRSMTSYAGLTIQAKRSPNITILSTTSRKGWSQFPRCHMDVNIQKMR